jgi:FdhD protein
MNDTVQPVGLVRIDGDGRQEVRDLVAVERALEVRLEGEPFSVIMRTPGEDRLLAAGFLFTEGVLRGGADFTAIEEAGEDVIDVRLSLARAADLPDLLGNRRHVAANSSCGMCGRRSLESLDAPALPLRSRWRVPASLVASLPDALARVQTAFAETGGLHGAALFHIDGTVERSAEDVGRHNAVDKLIGHMLLTGRLPLEDSLMAVSGRLSFEIVQKAWLAGIPLVAAVSAPSSLAIDLAGRAGMTLAGFVRGPRFNVYTGSERIHTAP